MLKTAPAGLWEAVVAFAARRPVWGICAGAILMAREVTHPAQRSLDLLDIGVSRNAYGSQIDSFVAEVALALAPPVTLPCIFIRAPRILRVGPGVKVLATHRGDPIMVGNERHLATTFHPELTAQPHLHRHFVQLAERAAAN
jgi:5'-phosphate synthase pdxT subunit